MKREDDYDLRLLRCFIAVAELRSFSAAAVQLKVAQPWLSHSIQKLERSFGYPLFERSTRSVSLNADGAALLPAARRLVDDAALLTAAVHARVRRQPGLLKIGTAHFLSDLPERMKLIEGIITRHSDLQIQVRTAWLSRLYKGVLEGEIDAALLVGPIDDPRLDTLVVRQSPLELVIPRSCPLARHKAVGFDQLRGHAVGLWRLPADAPVSRWLDESLKQHAGSVTPLPDDNFQASLNLAAQHKLIIPAPAAMLDSAKLPPTLVRRPLRKPGPSMTICLVRLNGRNEPTLEILWKLARSIAGAD